MKMYLPLILTLSVNAAYANLSCEFVVTSQYANEINKTTTKLGTSESPEHYKANIASNKMTAKAQAKIVETLIQELKIALAPENHKTRRDQDPRWLARFGLRKDKTNPYTLKLQHDLKKAERLQGRLMSLLNEITGITNFEQFSARDMREDDQLVLAWLLKSTDNFMSDLVEELSSPRIPEQKIARVIEKAKKLKERFKTFSRSLNGYRPNPLLSRMNSEMLSEQAEATAQIKYLRRVLGRETNSQYAYRLAQKTNGSKQEAKVLSELFKKIDDSGERLPNRNGIHDAYVTSLTLFAHETKLSAEKIVEYFKQVDDLGQNQMQNFTIQDAAVTLLTIYGLRTNTSAQEMVDSFYAVVRSWKSHTRKDMTFVDEDLAGMAIIARQLQIQESQVFDRYVEIEKLGRNIRNSYYINDFASIELARLSFVKQVSANEIVNQYKKVLNKLEKQSTAWGQSDNSVVRIMTLAQEVEVSTDRVADLAIEVGALHGDRSVSYIISFLEISLKSKFDALLSFGSSGRLLTHGELNYTQLFLLDRRLSQDKEWLGNIQAQFRSASQARGSSGGSSYRSSGSSGNSGGSSGDSNIIDPLQYAITGSITNFDANPFTPF